LRTETFSAVSRRPLVGFPETSYLALPTHALQTICCCDWSIMEDILVENRKSFRIYLVFHWRDFPNASYLLLSTLSLQMYKNGCDWSIIKGTLLGKQVILSAVSRLPLEVFSRNFTPRTLQHALKTMQVSSHSNNN